MMKLGVIILCGSWHVGHSKFSFGKAVMDEFVTVSETEAVNPEETAAAVACIQVLTSAPGSNLQKILVHLDVGKYWESFEVCAFVNKSLKHWNHCGGTVTKFVENVHWPACRMIDLCSRDAGLDAFHGVCYKQCENHMVEGKVKTNCTQSLLETGGLTSSRVCGDSLPKAATLQYMGAWDMMGTSLSSVFSAMMASLAQLIAPEKGISWNDAVGGMFHSWVLLLIICYAVNALMQANGACRFTVLSAPFQFAPFFFSYNQLAQLFLNQVSKLDENDKDEVQKEGDDANKEDENEGDDANKEDKKEGDDANKEATKDGEKLCGAGLCSMICVWAPFIILSGATLLFLIPMFVAAFWSFLAYIHIILLLFLAYACAGGAVYFVFWCVEKITKPGSGKEDDSKDDAQDNGNEEAKVEVQEQGEEGDEGQAKESIKQKMYHNVVEDRLFYIMAIATTQLIPFLNLVMASGFLLYFTGEWKPLHDGFFNDIGFPKFNWPKFSMFKNPEYLMTFLHQFFTFDVKIQMQDLFSLALVIQALLVFSKVGTAIFMKWRKSRNAKKETKAEENADDETACV